MVTIPADKGHGLALELACEIVSCCATQLAASLVSAPAVAGTAIPQQWPGDRFDVIWVFTLAQAAVQYTFSQVPQQLLSGDTDTVIPA